MRNSTRGRGQGSSSRRERGRGAARLIAAVIMLVVLVILAVIGYFFVQAVTGPRPSGASSVEPAATALAPVHDHPLRIA